MPKISGLPQDSSPSTDDYTITVDTTSGQAKKVSLSDLVTLIYANYPQTAWSSWTPTWSTFVKGNGTVSAKYIQIGKTVHFRIHVVFGSTTTMGSNSNYTLPVTAISYAGTAAQQVIGQIRYLDAGINAYFGQTMWGSTTIGTIEVGNAAGTYLNSGGVNNTIPFTWGTNDEFHINGTYEAA